MKHPNETKYRLEGERTFRVAANERLSGYREWLESRDHRRFGLVMLAVLAIGMTLVVSSKYMPTRYAFHVGQVSSRAVVADRTVSYEDKASTDNLRKQVASLVEPVHRTDPAAFGATLADVKALLDRVESVRAQSDGSSSPTSEPLGAALASLRERAPTQITDSTLAYLLKAPPEVIAQLRKEIPSDLGLLYSGTVSDAAMAGEREKLRGLADAISGPPELRDAVYQIGAAFLRPNQVVDDAQTEARRKQAMSEVNPVIVTVFKGEQVVKPGDEITAQTLLSLDAMGLVDTKPSWEIWAGTFIIVIIELVVIVGLVSRIQPTLLRENTVMLAITTLVMFFMVLARLLVIPPLSAYLVPLAALAMLTTILTRPRTALLLVALLSINVGLLAGFDFPVTMVVLISAVFSLYSVSRLAQRSDLLLAGVLVMIVAGAAVFAGELLRQAPLPTAFRTSLWGIGNGLLSVVLTVSLLMVYETVFNLTTPLRLLELANPSRPLLRRLMQVAPGTYNHSILMGNLAEAAAEVIDADPLLARVGAYYHDIGKIVRPEYFVENQLHMSNPHEKLTPNLSKLAITAHVRDGESLARAYGLPQPVIDIIRQHHGTSVLAYFYSKAKESSKVEVPEEAYRYEGEKPTSPEAAIIMLADSVEAAAKAMKNPTVKKMQDLIHDIFKQKMDDGQLDDAQLTLGDMHKIRDVFENGLRGLAGHRIAYPPKKEGAPEAVHARQVPKVAVGGGGVSPARTPKAGLRSVPTQRVATPIETEPAAMQDAESPDVRGEGDGGPPAGGGQ